uniref:Uncharacterized protein n=1 Tax=Ascaris lumbricoides TaxID=6252 RepID=A0A0M3IC95_ASCLU
MRLICSNSEIRNQTLQSAQDPFGEKGLVALAVSTANIQSNLCSVALNLSYAFSTSVKLLSICKKETFLSNEES